MDDEIDEPSTLEPGEVSVGRITMSYTLYYEDTEGFDSFGDYLRFLVDRSEARADAWEEIAQAALAVLVVGIEPIYVEHPEQVGEIAKDLGVPYLSPSDFN